MDVTYDLLPDPRYHPLPPSVDDLLTFADELDYEGRSITFEWAHNEIKNHLLSYVRVGLIAAKVKLYRVWEHSQQKFKDFKDYCEKGLGKSRWYVNRMIEAARVTLELMKAGFTELPQHESQARHLVKFQGEELYEKWKEILNSVPAHRITAAKIAEIVDDNPQPPVKQRVNVRTITWEKVKQAAQEAGMTPDDYLESLLDRTLDNKVDEVTEEQLKTWEADTNQLIEEYDTQLHSGTITKPTLPNNSERTTGDGETYWDVGGTCGDRNFSEGVPWRETYCRSH